MNRFIAYNILSLLCIGIYSQSLKYQGYPSRNGDIDLRSNFTNPPKGYGNVPFYWWNGDSLNYERLMDQLSILSDASTDGLSVSYIHTHPEVDIELNAQGYGSFGRADAGIPGFYTAEWWKLWNQFSSECAKRNIGLGVDDYVVGWAKNGFYVDEVLQTSDFKNYQGRLHYSSYTIRPGEKLDITLPKHTLSITAYPGKIDLGRYTQNGQLKWHPQIEEEKKVYIVYTTESPELHPQYGERLVEVYFNRFENKLDAQGKKGLNYFFQDELHYNLNIHSWCEDMQETFKSRKGYDILPYLPALWEYIGEITPKIRLDYAQIVTELAEERYFKPVFDWHNNRGLIYGCDNNGRGLEPLQYMDYFRAISWYTAPGNDAPARGSSFRQTKVSSSVAHLYKRPRTWLEAFHSMGWDSNGEWLTSQLDQHMIAGGNLLCLHGLYYSTHGGWWEWAPPCFHFRMPYWPHMKFWLKYAERMSFILSQGTHVCDIAIMYPTESMQAYPEANADILWKLTDNLSECGLDYDFIDYQSLQCAEVDSKQLHISDEKYKVLILADMKALHYETLLKIYEFYKKGGIVIAVGKLPKATTRIGEKDSQVETILHEIFKRNRIHESDIKNISQRITSLITPDFQVQNQKGKVLHRKIGNQDVYMVMNIQKGNEIFFRSKGKVEYWNAKNGVITEIPILRQTEEGTWIKYDAEYNESKLFVFTPGTPSYDNNKQAELQIVQEIPLEGEWEIEIMPTMNNKWGDFRLPATNEIIGPEARKFAYQFIPAGNKFTIEKGFQLANHGVYGYAPYMETLTLPNTEVLEDILSNGLSNRKWAPYCYSWQYGVYDNPGSQGFHGLKGKVDNRFIILDQGGHQVFRTYVYAPETRLYRMVQEGERPDFCYLDGSPIKQKIIEMKKGWHQLIFAYANTPKGSYILAEKKSNSIDNRKRSAIVFYPSDYPDIKENYAYDTIIAMKWFQTKHLSYSTRKDDSGIWVYQFKTAPGTQVLKMQLKGKINQLWIDDKPISMKNLKHISANDYSLYLGKYYTSGICTITMSAEPEPGNIGPAFFTTPVKMECKGGKLPAGNWTDFGALQFYSGGINYIKNINLPQNVHTQKTFLDLGKVNATCQVKINGKEVDILMHSPYKVDISSYIKSGSNRIEVLVYSTLSNHYQTIPSAYRGEPVSGLLGPVKIINYQ